MMHEMALPAGGRPGGQCGYRGGGTVFMLAQPGAVVNMSNGGALVLQAQANERRALAEAAWHRERACRYLAWSDLPWCAAQYDAHLAEAAFQERLAARHAAVAVALQGVDHG